MKTVTNERESLKGGLRGSMEGIWESLEGLERSWGTLAWKRLKWPLKDLGVPQTGLGGPQRRIVSLYVVVP